MDGQLNSQPHGSTRQTPLSQQNATKAPGKLSEGLDVFDLQLQNDCANVPGSFMGSLTANVAVGGPSPSPTAALSSAMFSSVATATHGLVSTMSNPQTTRCMVRDVAQVILRFISDHGEQQPESLADDFGRQLIFQFADELQRLTAAPTTGMTSGGDGRWTIDKEVVLSLKNGKDGPPPGAEVARPHHPYAGYCSATNGISPRVTAQHPQLRGTPPSIPSTAHVSGGAGANGNNNNNNNNARSVHGAIENFGLASVGTTGHQQPSLTVTSLSKRVGGGDVIRPQPQHPRNGIRTLMSQRRLMTNTKKVLRSASSAFSEYSAGETGEVCSSMSRTTIGTSALTK